MWIHCLRDDAKDGKGGGGPNNTEDGSGSHPYCVECDANHDYYAFSPINCLHVGDKGDGDLEFSNNSLDIKATDNIQQKI